MTLASILISIFIAYFILLCYDLRNQKKFNMVKFIFCCYCKCCKKQEKIEKLTGENWEKHDDELENGKHDKDELKSGKLDEDVDEKKLHNFGSKS